MILLVGEQTVQPIRGIQGKDSSFWSDHEATSKNHVVHVQWRSKSCLASLLIQRWLASFSNLGLGGASQLVQRSPHQKYPSSMYRLYRVYLSGL